MRSSTRPEFPSARHTYTLPARCGVSVFICVIFLLMLSARFAYLPRVMAASQKQSEIVAAVDKAEEDRERRLLGYSVQEIYSLYRRGDADPSAVMDVSTTYVKDKGKTYKIVSESGSRSGRFVLKKILRNEEELSHGQDRADLLITSRNYDMSLSDSAVHDFHGRDCQVLQIKPKRASPYLLDGKIWVDATDYHVVRVEGTAAAAASTLTGRPTIERDYTEVDGFQVATHAKSVSNQVLLGETVLDIKYVNYKLNFVEGNAHRAGAFPPQVSAKAEMLSRSH